MARYKHICCRCGFSWHSKLERPKQCPSCKQPRWDTPARARKVAPVKKITDQKVCACQKCGNFWTPRVESPVSCPYCKSIGWEKQPERPKGKGQDKKFHLVKVKDSEVLPLMARFYVGGGYTKNPEKAKLYSKAGAAKARLIGGVPWYEELFLVPAKEVKKLIRPDGMVARAELLRFYLSSLNADLKSRKV